MMKRLTLPGTALNVSPLCLGAADFGTKLDQDQIERFLDYFFSKGGNFLDTAHVYNDWVPGVKARSEKTIARALKNVRSDQVIISTKGAHYRLDHPEISRVNPREILIDLEESLDALETDCIDLYFLHRDNPDVPVSEIMDCLDEQVAEGRIRYIGCSNWTPDRIREAQKYARKTGKAGFSVNQLMWSMAKINPDGVPQDYALMNEETMALCREINMGVMCFSSQAGGYFTKRWQGTPLHGGMIRTYQNAENDRIFDEQIKPLSSSAQVTQCCLKYFTHQPVTAVPIVSCSSMEQLEECCGAF